MNLYSPPLLEKENTLIELKATKSSKVFSSLCQSFTVLVMLITLCACHSLGKRPMATVELRIDEKLNPDDLGRPLSMVVRLYELRRPDVFEKLTLHDLANTADEARLLGHDLIGRHEFILTPGTQRTIEWIPQAETTHVAWVGFYRNPKAQPWRQVLPVSQLGFGLMHLAVGACGLELSQLDADATLRNSPARNESARTDSAQAVARTACPPPTVVAAEAAQTTATPPVTPPLRSAINRREKKSR
jgi:type VI secretion system VasD/TssJ family lipoprotein